MRDVFRIYIFVLLIILGGPLSAQDEDFSMWRRAGNFISLSGYRSVLRNLYTHTCTEVRLTSRNFKGELVNMPAGSVLSFSSSPGVQVFRDIDCEQTLVQITSSFASNSFVFYVKGTALGQGWVRAAATGFRETWENTNLTESPFTWTGASGVDLNWTTGANWLGGVMPNSTQLAVFTDQCLLPGRNCNVVMNSNIDVGGVEIVTGYPTSATITQNPGVVVNIRNRGWTQRGGVFLGSNADFVFQRRLKLFSGSFTAPSTRIQHVTGSDPSGLYRQFFVLSPGVIFNHNNGLIQFNSASSFTFEFAVANQILNNLDFNRVGNVDFMNTTAIGIEGNLTADLSSFLYTNASTAPVTTFHVQRDVIIRGTGLGTKWEGPKTVIRLVGNPTSTPQVVSVPNENMLLPHLEIDTGNKPVIFGGLVGVRGMYRVLSVGTLTTAGSTLYIDPNWCMGTCDLQFEPAAYPLFYNNVKLLSKGAYLGFSGQALRVLGRLTLINSVTQFVDWNNYGYGMEQIPLGVGVTTGVMNWRFENGTVLASGDVMFEGLGPYNDVWREGSLQIKMVGNPSGQAIKSSNATFGMLPNLEIDSGPHTVNIEGAFALSGNFRYTSGVVSTSGSTVNLTSSPLVTTQSINAGPVRFNNVNIIRSEGTRPYTITGTLVADGNLSLSATSSNINFTKCGAKTFTAATIQFRGNYSVDTGTGLENCVYQPGPFTFSGPLALNFFGASQQLVTFSGVGAVRTSGNITIDNPLGISLASDVDWDNDTLQRFTMMPGSGNTLMNGRRLDIRSPALNGGRIVKGGGALYVDGALVTATGAMYGGFVDP